MNKRYLLAAAVAAALLSTAPLARTAEAQISISVGPQVSTLGIGVSGEVRLLGALGISAEYNFAPINSVERLGFGNSIIFDPTLGGGMLLVMLHPGGGKFAFGGGLMQGGLSIDGVAALDPSSGSTMEFNGRSYSAADIGTFNANLEYGSTQPAAVMGYSGKGFNFLIGAALAKPTLDAFATGPIGDDPTFKADLDAELQDVRDDLDLIPVYPYVRLGWQFGF